jgi:hypothetical protein
MTAAGSCELHVESNTLAMSDHAAIIEEMTYPQ